MSTESKLSLTANLLGLVAPFIGRGDIRYYLDGINVRPAKGGGAIIAATNGHALAMALDRNAVCEEEVILRVSDALLKACAMQPNRDWRRLELRNGRLTVTIGDGPDGDVHIQAGNPFVEGKYPEIFKVVPAQDSLKAGLIGAFNPALIDRISQAARHARAIKGGKHTLMPVQFYTKNGDRQEPCVARIIGFEEWAAVLMPAKFDEPNPAIPQFIFEKPEDAK